MSYVFYKPKIDIGDRIVIEFNISFLVCSFVLKIVNSEHFLKNSLGYFDETIHLGLSREHIKNTMRCLFTEVLQLIS